MSAERLFLPELVSGRGTAWQSRVVEGEPRTRLRLNPGYRARQIGKHQLRRNPQRRDAGNGEPRIARSIPPGPITEAMRTAIDLDRQARIAAIEVQHVRPARMLSAELQATGPFAQFTPQQPFRQAQFSSEATRPVDPAFAWLGRCIPEHWKSPSTTLWVVPLPETSSGRNERLSKDARLGVKS